jgi:RHS repeat-associated protein
VLNAFATCGAFRELSGTLYREANWLVADQLGTPRMIVNKSGSLSAVKRHDYLPFGEELFGGTGGRTTTQGYSGDSLRQKFTSKERDIETGLDFFGVRYYGSTQGRFTSVDPLLSSADVNRAKTWNRYSYALNNPLKYIDPTGAYTFTAELGGATSDADLQGEVGKGKRKQSDVDNIIKRRHRFRDALAEANAAGAKSNCPGCVARATSSYGDYLKDNGVVIGYGQNKNNLPGLTSSLNGAPLGFTQDGVRASVLVTIDNDASGLDLITAVAHEGSHVADRLAFANALNSLQEHNQDPETAYDTPYDPTTRTTETRAYFVSAYIAQGRGEPQYSPGGTTIWKSGWAEADRASIERLLRTSSDYRDKLNDRLIPKPK